MRSARFRLWTDLRHEEAEQQLARMERVVSLAAAYWGRELPGQIDVYLVDDLRRWSAADFPQASAWTVVNRLGGATDLERSTNSSRARFQSTIYATTRPGVVEHEVVHAYCHQTFGRGGPEWYREGMAELFAQYVGCGVQGPCRPEVLNRLRNAPPVSVRTIVADASLSEPLREMVKRLDQDQDDIAAGDDDPHAAHVMTDDDGALIEQTHLAYARSWALCHLLSTNCNYRQRFRALGRHYLAGGAVDFEGAFGAVSSEIEFEYANLTKDLATGYRADLCGWEWQRGSRDLPVGGSTAISLRACRGYQSTGLVLEEGHEYEVTATGTWRLNANAPGVDADGMADGQGCVEAAVLDEFDLSPPQELGKKSTFVAKSDGRLYLRCRDHWSELSDNRGTILVRLTRVR